MLCMLCISSFGQPMHQTQKAAVRHQQAVLRAVSKKAAMLELFVDVVEKANGHALVTRAFVVCVFGLLLCCMLCGQPVAKTLKCCAKSRGP